MRRADEKLACRVVFSIIVSNEYLDGGEQWCFSSTRVSTYKLKQVFISVLQHHLDLQGLVAAIGDKGRIDCLEYTRATLETLNPATS
jgi:hypothetical protein